ncbi:GNAT family N-acetyltransferase [Azospirillum canadense]|uniref:GNAT family N-acetyltransferase n=1 Tax=Azospirillum canadense TaxID=403962 RepID=UPI002225DD50|nr:GNAT family N-acetyltransferase [Azospirillum canadense]MCW2240390.1 GNAT superfamily N-acetyltransferase [Azospirillum canadense]
MPDGSFFLSETPATAVSATSTSRRYNHIRVQVARGHDDLMACMVIRATVWLTMPGAVYSEHYDENDFSCTHLIVFSGDEPVGTLRLRWLRDEARFERLSIREEHRSLPVLRRLVEFALDLIAAKGYTRASGMTRERGLKFWDRRGAKVVGAPVPYHGEAVVPIQIHLTETAHPALAAGPGHPAYEAALLLPESRLMERRSVSRVAA